MNLSKPESSCTAAFLQEKRPSCSSASVVTQPALSRKCYVRPCKGSQLLQDPGDSTVGFLC